MTDFAQLKLAQQAISLLLLMLWLGLVLWCVHPAFGFWLLG
ncbi:hypothetical protein [Shewanella sp. GXUN23E]